MIGRSRMNTLAKIKQKVWQKIQTWKENLLSQRDKDILIKAAALAIPTYTISCLNFLRSLHPVREVDSPLLVESKGGEKYLLDWVEKLCLSKYQGGLGFRDLKTYNLVLLAKQVWMILQNEDLYFIKFLKQGTFLKHIFLKLC